MEQFTMYLKNILIKFGQSDSRFFIVFNKASHRKLKSVKKLDCKYLYFGSLRNNEASIKIKKKI